MRCKILLAFVFTLSTLLCADVEADATKVELCLRKIDKLNHEKDAILENGGMWGRFSKSANLRASATKGLQLDSKINRIMSVLQYLCETVDGVPLNALAIYLVENLRHKSKKSFRAELIILGKNHGVIDVWWKFHEASLQNQYRPLKLGAIEKSIQKARGLLDKCGDLQKIAGQADNAPALKLTLSLLEEIDSFFSNDPMMSMAIKEDAQVPYWDINESSGGS